MAATFASILPQLSTVLLAGISISNRTLRVPLDYPKALDSAELPVFINRFAGLRELTPSQRETRMFAVTINCTLYLAYATSGIEILNQYDLYGYLDQLTDCFMTYPRLEVSNIALAGMVSNIEIASGGRVPELLPYPRESNEAPLYWATEFTIAFQFEKTKANC